MGVDPCVRAAGADGGRGGSGESVQHPFHITLHRARVRLPLPPGELPTIVLRHEQYRLQVHVMGEATLVSRRLQPLTAPPLRA